jgi:DNA polymerase sigma
MKSKTKCVAMPKDYCSTRWTKIETEELKKMTKELLEARSLIAFYEKELKGKEALIEGLYKIIASQRDKLNKLRTFCSAHLGKEWSEWILDNVLNKK